MAYGRDRPAATGTPTQYRQFSFNLGARHYLAGQKSTKGSGRSAVADYNRLTRNLQTRDAPGQYLSQYNKDKFLSALGHLQNKAQQTAEAKYEEYLQSVSNPKFASKPGASGALMRAPNEYDLSANTGMYTKDPKTLFNLVDRSKYYQPWSHSMTDTGRGSTMSFGSGTSRTEQNAQIGTYNPYSHPERLNFGKWT